jgi:hypothetical protein
MQVIPHLVTSGTRVRLRVIVAKARNASKPSHAPDFLGRKGVIRYLERLQAVVEWDGSKDLERVSLEDLVLC